MAYTRRWEIVRTRVWAGGATDEELALQREQWKRSGQFRKGDSIVTAHRVISALGARIACDVMVQRRKRPTEAK